MGKFSRVYLDTSQRQKSSYFDGVPEEVWNFHVGGYQVLRKWLYDRRETPSQPGRALTEEDIAHYQRVVVALQGDDPADGRDRRRNRHPRRVAD